MIQILRINPEILPIFPYMLFLRIPTQRFSHIKSILTPLLAGRIIAIVIDHTSENGIPATTTKSSIILVRVTT